MRTTPFGVHRGCRRMISWAFRGLTTSFLGAHRLPNLIFVALYGSLLKSNSGAPSAYPLLCGNAWPEDRKPYGARTSANREPRMLTEGLSGGHALPHRIQHVSAHQLGE